MDSNDLIHSRILKIYVLSCSLFCSSPQIYDCLSLEKSEKKKFIGNRLDAIVKSEELVGESLIGLLVSPLDRRSSPTPEKYRQSLRCDL